jgi:biotin carboxyl carrier protein
VGRAARFTALVGDATRTVEVVAMDDGRWRITIDGQAHEVDARPTSHASYSLLTEHAAAEVSVLARGDSYAVQVGGRVHRIRLLDERAMRLHGRSALGGGSRELRAAMPGKVVAVLVEVGATVEAGQGVLVIEAMKMENELTAARAGTVQELRVKPGQAVEAGELLAVIE